MQVKRTGSIPEKTLELASLLSKLSSNITHRHADGVFCHVDQAEVRAEIRQLIPELEKMAREPGE